jgi:hypothetical protein
MDRSLDMGELWVLVRAVKDLKLSVLRVSFTPSAKARQPLAP